MQMTDFIVIIGEWSADSLATTVYIIYKTIISYHNNLRIQRIEKEAFAHYLSSVCVFLSTITVNSKFVY